MDSTRSPDDPSAYLQSLMQAGQQSFKQFDDAMAAAMGLGDKPGEQEASPLVAAANLQRDAILQVWKFWNTTLVKALGIEEKIQPGRGDRRFKDDAWAASPYYDLLKQSYLVGSKQLTDLVEQAQVDDRTRLQLKFYARQFIDAMSPSNFPATNPEVIRTAIQTRSASLAAGMSNLIEDFQKGRITRVDESKFEVGGNLANTPGSVIYENELIQLIQYTPVAAEVEKTPLLIVPPCINKYYLLDLGKGNSFVEYAVAQGHQVFLISWRSAVPEIGHLTWNDYLRLGPLKSIDVAREIAGVDKVHALGFCVGGTIVSCAAGVLAARGEDKLSTLTLLTTMVDFSDTGEIGLLIDQGHVVLREATIGNGGILPGKELAFTFGTLRANDLIWRYVVDSYLKGATPDAFDLLYWDSDSVSLPGPMYCWYTRNTYLENKIREPGKTTQCGEDIDLSKIKVPLYVLASREDHIVPWRSAYLTKNLMGKEPRFVLAASGHVAGVINPPAKNRRSHWLNDDVSGNADAWLDKAVEHPGSWWDDWDAWLKRHSTGKVAAPPQAGNEHYRVIEPAPGRYVKLKSN
ncbi:MAG: class I poly(R)-hydroxyalkanoic acid synthase [Bradyrhizobium sp.]|nr:class I poly(R)-hydroxyalkanoic acid synthase [Bradyrhizobium sp.]